MPPPLLVTCLDGVEVSRLGGTLPFGSRAWLLGVVALQVSVAGGRVQARLRIHLTGTASPTVIALAAEATIAVALVTPGDPPPAPEPCAPPALAGAAARVALHLDGALVAAVALAGDALAAAPPPRAFSHVFCRFLRGGATEPGFDLTDFSAPAAGEKYERVASGPLRVDQVITIAYAAAP